MNGQAFEALYGSRPEFVVVNPDPTTTISTPGPTTVPTERTDTDLNPGIYVGIALGATVLALLSTVPAILYYC